MEHLAVVVLHDSPRSVFHWPAALVPSPSTVSGLLLLPLLLLALTQSHCWAGVSLPAAILGPSAVKRLLTSH